MIDDGSTDGSTEIARLALADSPFPCRFIARENRGATATINEAISLSSAPFINVLNSDDWFSDDRIALMVEHVAARGAHWGFSETAYVDDRDRPIDPRLDKRAGTLSAVAGAASRHATVGFSFLGGNAAISSGNLFFSRALFQRVGPFGSLRYNHDWEFALRAVRAAEPTVRTGADVSLPPARQQYDQRRDQRRRNERGECHADGVLPLGFERASQRESAGADDANLGDVFCLLLPEQRMGRLVRTRRASPPGS